MTINSAKLLRNCCVYSSVFSALIFSATLILTANLLSGCSSNSASTKRNTISPYDTDFDPEKSSNYSPDSVDTPEIELLELAKDSYDRGLFSVARENWTKLRDGYPLSLYATLAELKIADCHYYSGDFSAAISAYEEFIKLHPGHESAPYASYQIGRAFQEQYTGPDRDQAPLLSAIKNYRQLIQNYPQHEFATIARRGLDECREKLAEHELLVGKYYIEHGREKSAAGRLNGLRSTYPETKSATLAADLLREHGLEVLALGVSKAKAGTDSASSLQAEQKQPANTPPPAAPKLLTNLGFTPESPKTDNEFRRVNQSDIAIHGAKDAVEQPKSEVKLVGSISCEEAGQFSIFSGNLLRHLTLMKKRLVTPAGTTTAYLSAANTRLTESELKTLKVVPESTQSCAIKGTTVEVIELISTENPAVKLLRLEIKSVSGTSFHIFSLDRPERVIAVWEQVATPKNIAKIAANSGLESTK